MDIYNREFSFCICFVLMYDSNTEFFKIFYGKNDSRRQNTQVHNRLLEF